MDCPTALEKMISNGWDADPSIRPSCGDFLELLPPQVAMDVRSADDFMEDEAGIRGCGGIGVHPGTHGRSILGVMEPTGEKEKEKGL